MKATGSEKLLFDPQASLLVKTIQRLAAARSIDEITSVVKSAARALVDADGAAFVLRRGDDCYYADEEAISPLWKGQRFPLTRCISGWVMINNQQISISEIYSDPRIPHDAYRATFVKSLVMTPVRTDFPIAAIGTYWSHEHEPSETDLHLLQTLADSTAVAIANVNVVSQLEDTLESLEKRVQERTRELQIARDEALTASQMKSSFVAFISHELRTPLAGMITSAELLATSMMDPDFKDLAELLLSSGQNLLEILNDILDLAKIEAGKLTIESTAYEIRAVLNEVRSTLAIAASKKDVDLRVVVDDDVPNIAVGDSTRLRQVLLNLAGNALKFTSKGTVDIQISQLTDADQNWLKLCVKDTGIGMDAEQQTHLFMDFSQADGSIARRFGGTGLGLSICKRLIELMNGKITCESQPGVGTNFTVLLPLTVAEALIDSKKANPKQIGKLAGRVLLVEDNVFMSSLAVRQLNSIGIATSAATNGAEAIELFEREAFDAVLMDCNLPDMDGFEATKRIRSIEKVIAKPKTIPIIALTADAMAEDCERSLQAGMDGHLTKPITIDGLHAALAPYLKAKSES